MSAPSKTRAELIAEYIEPPDEWTAPYDARVRPHAVKIRAVIGQYLATGEDPASVAYDYDLPLEAVLAALAYYEQHQQIVDAWLLVNTGQD